MFSPAASRAPVRSLPQCKHAAPPCARSCRPSWARPWAARVALAEAEPGQAGPHTCYAGRLRWHCATGPSADLTQWHLIIFLYFLNIFNSLQIQNFV
jgi:hypothetical protein